MTRRGGILLEVLLSLALFVGAAAFALGATRGVRASKRPVSCHASSFKRKRRPARLQLRQWLGRPEEIPRPKLSLR